MKSKFAPDQSIENEIKSLVAGKSVLVTGGTGSFGKAFIKRLLEFQAPRRLIVFSRDELKQFEMQMHPDFNERDEMRYFIGDVRDHARLEMAMRDVEIVVHAAALKQVTTAEYNPFECIRTNVIGAENVVRAAISCGVKRVVALSTDKAVNPINLYGASKLASDKIFVAANNLSSGGTSFSVVRYGNVAGSRGSVVPFFRKLIEDDTGYLPITDERMTRFWMTLAESCDLVLSSLRSMQGGEVFVPKIPSIKIVDLARAMSPHWPHKIVGIRPGEKLHEILITEDDASATIDCGNWYVIEPTFVKMFSPGRDYASQGGRVKNRFVFTSDKNTEWLEGRELARMIAQGTF